jgi:DNA-binding GntR family transcriptional regulator
MGMSPESLCAAIRHGVIRGEYAAGQRLTEEELAAQFGVSRMSVREALRVLAAEGFIRVQPYFGTFVAEMTAKQAGDLLEVQGALEPLAAGLAATRRTPDHLAELKAIVEQGRQAARQGRAEEAWALNGRFHAVLAAASGNDSLSVLITQLRDKIDWVYSTQVRRPPGDSWEEHDEIVAAIEKGNAALAVQAAQSHIQRATPIMASRVTKPARDSSPSPSLSAGRIGNTR